MSQKSVGSAKSWVFRDFCTITNVQNISKLIVLFSDFVHHNWNIYEPFREKTAMISTILICLRKPQRNNWHSHGIWERGIVEVFRSRFVNALKETCNSIPVDDSGVLSHLVPVNCFLDVFGKTWSSLPSLPSFAHEKRSPLHLVWCTPWWQRPQALWLLSIYIDETTIYEADTSPVPRVIQLELGVFLCLWTKVLGLLSLCCLQDEERVMHFWREMCKSFVRQQ